ncbi:hypothetical protein Q8F55_008525 [Vanrija albida]|uniref:Uncharacterized protein n=1 Tax=Vanrija albida TaxID=181172 RepID=A0ABR3PS38_9TREE
MSHPHDHPVHAPATPSPLPITLALTMTTNTPDWLLAALKVVDTVHSAVAGDGGEGNVLIRTCGVDGGIAAIRSVFTIQANTHANSSPHLGALDRYRGKHGAGFVEYAISTASAIVAYIDGLDELRSIAYRFIYCCLKSHLDNATDASHSEFKVILDDTVRMAVEQSQAFRTNLGNEVNKAEQKLKHLGLIGTLDAGGVVAGPSCDNNLTEDLGLTDTKASDETMMTGLDLESAFSGGSM